MRLSKSVDGVRHRGNSARIQRTPERAVHVAASNCQLPGTPFKLWLPRSSKRRPDPATRSLTVRDTNIS